MPIEPTSVSKPQVREIESTSANFGSWTSMQGSSTGGKDRPIASIWEKAINGAQKLFGSASTDTATLDESREKEDSPDSGEDRDRESTAFDTAPGFGNRRFGSFGGSAWGGNTFGSVATSRAAPDSFNAAAERSAAIDAVEGRRSDFVAQEKSSQQEQGPVQERPAKEKPVVQDKQDDDEASQAKSAEAASVLARSRTLATVAQSSAPVVAPASAQSAPVETAGQQQAAVAASAAVANTVPQASPNQAQAKVSSISSEAGVQLPSQTSVPQAPAAETSAKMPTPLVSSANEVGKSQTTPPTTVASATQAAKSEVQAPQPAQPSLAKPEAPQEEPVVKAPAVATTSEDAKKSDLPVRPVSAQTVAKHAVEGVQNDMAAGKEGLAFDLNKAKETLSDALGKVAAKPTLASPQATAPVSTAAPATAPATTEPRDSGLKPQAGEAGQIRLPEGAVADSKETSPLELSKRELTLSAHQRSSTAKASTDASAQSRSNSAEAVASDARSAQVTAGASANQFSRETAAAAASRMQASGASPSKGPAPSAQNGTAQVGLNAVSGGQGIANGLSTQAGGQQGASQNSDGDPAAKQEFSAALKQATSAKGSEKAADGSESFDVKAEAAATRRGEAASKVRQTSYVSKTAEEVKEVIATLTKSIDRLVTDKSGAMNLKINFEGGGSLKLSVSMEGGQVVTSMQTDVVGLEGAIKSNWAELANDWNQKGLKLNAPQFQDSEFGKDSSENLNEFSSRQDRQTESRFGEGRGQGSSRTATRGFASSGAADGSGAGETPSSEAAQQVVSDTELKAYA